MLQNEKKTLKICAHLGIDPGPMVSLTTRPLGQVARGSKQPYT